MAKIKVYVSIDQDVLASFKAFCSRNGMKVSTKVEQMMKNQPLQAEIKSYS